ncbi:MULTISPECIES: ParA family protein [Terrabacteria group]|uniref:ParA family protein n=1 Tax=Bacillati TaxID=1783272 RepID=UPI00193A97F6|nr:MULTISPECIES: ParA family protein [Terrabacteria group]MBW9213189.1 ParA family protein [Trueperella sp. zg.1013]QRG86919.1 ParA family protein [Bulleidia sp. zg-1006]
MIRSIINIKGGVGKTTTALQLSEGFAKEGKKTLLVDCDGQGNATNYLLPNLNFDEDETISRRNLAGLLMKKEEVRDCLWKSDFENLYVLPASLELFNVAYTLQSNSANGLPQFSLNKILKSLDFDEIVIDNNPALNLMTINSIYAADEIIIVSNIDRNSFKGVKDTYTNTINALNELPRENPVKIRILITMVNRNSTEKEALRQLKEIYGDVVYNQTIRYQAKAIRETYFLHTSLLDYKKANVAEDYRNWIEEVQE